MAVTTAEDSKTLDTPCQVKDKDPEKAACKDDDDACSSGTTTSKTQVDGGWGWVIVFVSFVVHMLADGLGFTFGILYIDIMEHFQTSSSVTAWIGSLQASLTLILGFISGALVNVYGCRPVMIGGAVFVSAGYALSVLAPNIYVLYVTCGFMPGFGFSLMYIPSVVAVQYYFKKKRALATGLAFCGTGAGVFAFAPLTRVLLDKFGWRGTLLIQGGIVLVTGVPLGALVRPMEIVEISETDNEMKSAEDTAKAKEVEMSQSYQEQEDTCAKRTLGRWADIRREIGRALKEITDFSLMKNPVIFIAVISGFLWSCGHLPPFHYLPSLAKNLGIEEVRASFLISIMGIGNTCSRVVFGWLADIPRVNRVALFNVAVILAGVSTMLSPLATLYWQLSTYAAFFGLFLGCYMSTLPVALVDLVGVERIARSFGIVMSSAGLAALVVIPFAGWLHDVAGNYAIPFYVVGAVQAVGGLVQFLVILPCMSAPRRRYDVQEAAQTTDAQTNVPRDTGRDSDWCSVVEIKRSDSGTVIIDKPDSSILQERF